MSRKKQFERVTKALAELEAALKGVGIDHFAVKLIDQEDAGKLDPVMTDEHPIKAPNFPGSILAYVAKIGSVEITWRAIKRAQRKEPGYAARMAEERRRQKLEEEADRVASNARLAFLAERGGLTTGAGQ